MIRFPCRDSSSLVFCIFAAISDAHSSLGTSTSCFYDSGSALWECNQRYLLTVGDIDKARQALVRHPASFDTCASPA
jgi:hypothetical protein